MIGRDARSIDLPAQRYDTRIVPHSFPRSLLAAIGDWRSHDQIIESAPFGERELESSKQRTEECYTSLTGQFPCPISQSLRDGGKPSLGCSWRDRRIPH